MEEATVGPVYFSTRLFNYLSRKTGWSVFRLVLVFHAVPFALYWFIFYWEKRHVSDISLWLTSSFGLIWVGLSPYFIWRYEAGTLGRFFKESILAPEEVDGFRRLFSRHFYVVAIPWITMMMLGAFIGSGVQAQFGILSFRDPFFILGVGIGFYSGLQNSIGFWGVLTTIRIIKKCIKKGLAVQPYHPDRLGGLSLYGYLAIETSVLFSTGSLFLPPILYILRVSKFDPAQGTVLIGLVSTLMGFIVMSFVYPTWLVCQAANKIRRKILAPIASELDRIVSGMLCSENRIDYEGRFSTLKAVYTDLSEMKLYPWNIDIVLTFVMAILLPLGVAFLDHFLERLVTSVVR